MKELCGSQEVSKEEDGFYEMKRTRAECVGAWRLGVMGYGSYIDSCLALANGAGMKPGRSVEEQICIEGWTLYHYGAIDAVVDYIRDCVDYFAGRNTSGAKCKQGWKEEVHGEHDFIDDCLGIWRGGDATRLKCRRGWKQHRAGLANTCATFVDLASRNPRAEGVAAWTIDSFSHFDLDPRYPSCLAPAR